MDGGPRRRTGAQRHGGAVKYISSILLLAFCACQSLVVTPPPGFVTYPSGPGKDFRALSAEGIALRAVRVDNEPASDVALWTKSLRLNLEQRGYKVRSEEAVTAGGLQGRMLRTVTRSENQDFGYICALFVSGKDLFIVESAGAYPEFQARENEVVKSIQTFKAASLRN